MVGNKGRTVIGTAAPSAHNKAWHTNNWRSLHAKHTLCVDGLTAASFIGYSITRHYDSRVTGRIAGTALAVAMAVCAHQVVTIMANHRAARELHGALCEHWFTQSMHCRSALHCIASAKDTKQPRAPTGEAPDSLKSLTK